MIERGRLGERILAVAGGLAAAGYLLGLGSPAWWLIVKPVPALCLAAWVAGRGRGRGARWFALGLLVSAAGDELLELGRGLFLAGLGAFLLAHLAYTAGFLMENRRPALVRAVPFVLWGALGFLAMRSDLGPVGGPVVVYMAAITAMMWRAAAGVGHDGPPRAHQWLALGGAVLFGASDTLIGLDRFHGPLESARVPIIILYWLGQLGIAAGAVFRRE